MSSAAIRIDRQVGLALVELSGEVTGADIVEAAHTLHDLPEWDRRFDVIWDGRSVTMLSIMPGDLSDMVEAKVNDSIGKEIVVAVREIDQMMANLCALLLRARGREAKVVATLGEAVVEAGLDRLPAVLERFGE